MVTLKNYTEVFAEDQIAHALANTVVAGIATATLTMILSLVVAWVIVRSRFKGRTLLDALTFLPHAIPGVIVGIALIFLYLNPPLNLVPIYGTSLSAAGR
jgi:iron(III) transport system permease protein